jgi:hypothetical protein
LKSVHERQEEKRQEKLAEIQEQVEAGTLVIRKMTAEERKKYPRVEDAPKGKRGRGRSSG